MKNISFNSIDEYIAGFDTPQQKLMRQLRQLILKAAPAQTTETISYKMPTFRYNGNLIHFAMYQHHLGLYPGPEAIVHFAEDLRTYKTSKGAIQLPLDQPLPKSLIQQIIKFNVTSFEHKQKPGWLAYRNKWDDAEEIMQQIIAQTALTKTLKWGSDVYTYNNKNVVSWAGFKNYFAIWFFNGVFLSDIEKVLINASDGKTKSLRQWRFERISDMNPKKILMYINEAIQIAKDDKEIKPDKAQKLKPEGWLQAALHKDKELNAAFKKLSSGKQNEYILHIEEAKQDKTKQNRIEKIKPLILAGTGLNDKYKRK